MNEWLTSPNVSDELKEQIKSYDEHKLKIAFQTKIEFGTAGMRGTMGAGDGYINENIINWATIGYAKYLNDKFNNPKVVIAYDNRKNSCYYANLCASILSNFNIKVYIFDVLTSTPQLSYTIRELNANGGINITASHNPKTDNGYKLYNEKGCQYLPKDINEILAFINQVKKPIDIAINKDAQIKNITNIKSVDSTYMNFVNEITHSKFEVYEKILVTPLHGCSATAFKRICELSNFKNISFVKEQMIADPEFTTAISPNPDSKQAYEYAIKNNHKNCNYILANDPDADRVGVYDVREDLLYTGNQIATLLIDYLIQVNNYNHKHKVVTSVVSSMLPIKIAKKHNLSTSVVLTGFKYIGEQIDDNFILGYEESNGYLMHTKTRDKDGIASAFKIIEMINYYYNQGITLYDKLQQIYQNYNYYLETQSSISIKDNSLVNKVFDKISLDSFENIYCIENYQTLQTTYRDCTKKIDLPQTNMLKVVFNDESWFAIRPSGTEPKIKVYYNIIDSNKEIAKKRLDILKENVLTLFE